jgi:hypothetical protein
MLVRNPRGPWVRLAFMIGAVGLFMLGYFWGNQYQLRNEGPPSIEGVLLRPPLPLHSFELQDADGRRVTPADLGGRWTLLAFGDLAQASGHLAVNRLIEVYNRLADRPETRGRVQLAVVAEAAPPALARDFTRLSPALRVLTGLPAQIEALRAALGEGDEAGKPFYLIDPRGELRALFAGGQTPASVATDVAALADHPDAPQSDTAR